MPLNARKFVCDGLQKLVAGNGQATSDSELKKWFQKSLGLSYSSTWRKLSGESAWDDRDLHKVAVGLDISFEDLLMSLSFGGARVVPARVEVGTIQKDLKVVIGAALPKAEAHTLVAYQVDDQWHVADASNITRFNAVGAHEVLSINFSEVVKRQRLFALVDDDESITETASALLKFEGISAKCFSDAQSFIDELGKTKFDAYIIDWFLSADPGDLLPTTAEALIRQIRESEHGRTAPIAIVTGKIMGDNDVVVDELSRVATQYDCTPMIKPVQWRFVGSDLLKRLG